MVKERPDHKDAELAFRAYELRREVVMRESRNALNFTFWPRSYDELKAVATPGHPLNAAFRQVSTYWEMVYGTVRHGIVNADYFLESNAEGLFLLAKVLPYLAEYRRDFFPTAFQNAEWVAQETEKGKRMLPLIQARIAAMLQAQLAQKAQQTK